MTARQFKRKKMKEYGILPKMWKMRSKRKHYSGKSCGLCGAPAVQSVCGCATNPDFHPERDMK